MISLSRILAAAAGMLLLVAPATVHATPTIDQVNQLRAQCGLGPVQSDGQAASDRFAAIKAERDQLGNPLGAFIDADYQLKSRWPSGDGEVDSETLHLWKSDSLRPGTETFTYVDRTYSPTDVVSFLLSARMMILDPRLAAYDVSEVSGPADFVRWRLDLSRPFTTPVQWPCGGATVSPLDAAAVSVLLPPDIAAKRIVLRDRKTGRTVDLRCGHEVKDACTYSSAGARMLMLQGGRLARLPFGATYAGKVGVFPVQLRLRGAPAKLRRGSVHVKDGPVKHGRALFARATAQLPAALRGPARQSLGTITAMHMPTNSISSGFGCGRNDAGYTSDKACVYDLDVRSRDTFYATQAIAFAVFRAGLDDDTVIAAFHRAYVAGYKRRGKRLGTPCEPEVMTRCGYIPMTQFVAEFMAAAGKPIAPKPGFTPVLHRATFLRLLRTHYRLSAAQVDCKATKLCRFDPSL